VTAAALEETAAKGLEALDALLLDPLAGLGDWERVVVDPAGAARLRQGQALRLPAGGKPGPVAVVDHRPALLGLAELDAEGVLRPRRWLA